MRLKQSKKQKSGLRKRKKFKEDIMYYKDAYDRMEEELKDQAYWQKPGTYDRMKGKKTKKQQEQEYLEKMNIEQPQPLDRAIGGGLGYRPSPEKFAFGALTDTQAPVPMGYRLGPGEERQAIPNYQQSPLIQAYQQQRQYRRPLFQEGPLWQGKMPFESPRSRRK